MDGELNQNLPTTPRKKPIFIVKHSTRSINAKSQKKEGDRDHHFEERTHPKRIKYNNSNNYYVTDDGFVFPLDSNENFSPLNLVNMSNKVTKVKYEKSTGILIYYLAPKYDISDVFPWRSVSEKLKYSDDQDLMSLSQSLENLMESRDKFFQDELLQKCRIKSTHEEPLKFVLNEKLPQLAEVREFAKIDHLEHFPIKKIAINKLMMEVLKADPKAEPIESFYRGIKNSLKINDPKEGYSFLCGVYDCYRQCYQQSEGQANEKILGKVSVQTKEGKEIIYEVRAKVEILGEAIVAYYTMYLNEMADSEESVDTEKQEAVSENLATETNEVEERSYEHYKRIFEDYVSSFAKSFPEYSKAIAVSRKKQTGRLKNSMLKS